MMVQAIAVGNPAKIIKYRNSKIANMSYQPIPMSIER
jgi:hypothetical protein